MKMRTCFMILCLGLIVLAASSNALTETIEECYEKGKKYYDQNNFKDAYTWLFKAAKQGHTTAQNNLDAIYVALETNSAGTGYGITQSFTTTASSGTVTDIDGNIYQTVTIGSQVWMAENLKVTHYRNGDAIPHVTDNGAWSGLSTGAYCNYNNNEGNVAVYGRLYNWFAVDDGRNIAPAGWHVPSDAEWKHLEIYLGMSQTQADAEDVSRGMGQGGKLKETGTTHWKPNRGATNESGFTALPGGYRGYQAMSPNQYGFFYWRGENAFFWSSTVSSSLSAWDRILSNYHSELSRYGTYKHWGLSVRCVRD